MKRNTLFVVGLVLVLTVLVFFSVAPKVFQGEAPQEHLDANVLGGLLFTDPEFVNYMETTYNITIHETMMGSFKQAEADLTNVACLVPGSLTAANYFDELHPGMALQKDTIGRTFIVIYARKANAEKLVKAGLATKNGDSYFMKMSPVINARNLDQAWQDLGVDIRNPQTGAPMPVNIEYTDPLKSSSGMVFLQLVADYLSPGGQNGGQVATADDMASILPVIYHNWEAQGLQKTSSPELFAAFLQAGDGMPFVVNYESEFPGWYVNNYDSLDAASKAAADDIVGIYPEVSINTDHILISLTPTCQKIANIILTDPWVAEHQWAKLGLRNNVGQIGKESGVQMPWLADSVQSMSELKKSLSDQIKAILK